MRHLILLLSLFLLCSSAFAQNHLLILNKSGNTAWQLHAATGEQLAVYKTGTAPHEVAVSPNKKWAVITNYGNDEPGNTLTVLDLGKQEVAKTINLDSFRRPHGVEWFSDNRRVVVSVEEQQSVIIVDVHEGKVLSDIETNQEVSHMVELSEDERRIYVTNLGSGSLTVLDIPGRKIIKTIETGQGTEGLTLANSGNELWITNRASDTISILDTQTLEIINTITSKGFPIRAETSPDGRYVAVSNARASSTTVFNADTKEKLATISTKTPGVKEGIPIGLIFSNDNSRLYVANSNADQIVVINTNSWKVMNTFKTGATPDGIAYITSE
ncbi:MAG: YncE family protein [Candidatus Halalkalibacterium sp. M3_1C_030]